MTEREADESEEALRRLVSLARVPALADLDPEALSVLAARATDISAPTGVPLPAADGAIRILSRGAALGVSPRSTITSRSPELVPWLAGRDVATTTAPRAGESVIELPRAALRAVLRNDFLGSLALARALASQVVDREEELGVAARIVAAMERRLDIPKQRLDLTARALALRASLPFAHAHVGLMFQLAREATELRPRDGRALWQRGHASNDVLLVLAGTIHARAQGTDAFVARAGAAVGLFEALASRPRWYRAIAGDSLVALSLSVDRLLDLLEDQPSFTAALLARLAQALLLTTDEAGRTERSLPP